MGDCHRPSDSVLAELDSKLRITRKSSEAQRMLWFNVYNHDFPRGGWMPTSPVGPRRKEAIQDGAPPGGGCGLRTAASIPTTWN